MHDCIFQSPSLPTRPLWPGAPVIWIALATQAARIDCASTPVPLEIPVLHLPTAKLSITTPFALAQMGILEIRKLIVDFVSKISLLLC